VSDVRIESLCTLIAVQLRKPVELVQPTTQLVEELEIDSLEMQTLVLAIDEVWGVMPEAHHLRRVRTVADLHATVQGLLTGG
jgi:acyl carrier protein